MEAALNRINERLDKLEGKNNVNSSRFSVRLISSGLPFRMPKSGRLRVRSPIKTPLTAPQIAEANIMVGSDLILN
jgi:hypothetical protein